MRSQRHMKISLSEIVSGQTAKNCTLHTVKVVSTTLEGDTRVWSSRLCYIAHDLPVWLFDGWVFNAVQIDSIYCWPCISSGSIAGSNKHHSWPFARLLFLLALQSNVPGVNE